MARISYVSTLSPVVICPYLCTSDPRAATAGNPTLRAAPDFARGAAKRPSSALTRPIPILGFFMPRLLEAECLRGIGNPRSFVCALTAARSESPPARGAVPEGVPSACLPHVPVVPEPQDADDVRSSSVGPPPAVAEKSKRFSQRWFRAT